jgi:hypothetical protein
MSRCEDPRLDVAHRGSSVNQNDRHALAFAATAEQPDQTRSPRPTVPLCNTQPRQSEDESLIGRDNIHQNLLVSVESGVRPMIRPVHPSGDPPALTPILRHSFPRYPRCVDSESFRPVERVMIDAAMTVRVR